MYFYTLTKDDIGNALLTANATTIDWLEHAMRSLDNGASTGLLVLLWNLWNERNSW